MDGRLFLICKVDVAKYILQYPLCEHTSLWMCAYGVRRLAIVIPGPIYEMKIQPGDCHQSDIELQVFRDATVGYVILCSMTAWRGIRGCITVLPNDKYLAILTLPLLMQLMLSMIFADEAKLLCFFRSVPAHWPSCNIAFKICSRTKWTIVDLDSSANLTRLITVGR